MALLDQAKAVAKQEIMAAIDVASQASGIGMKLRTIKYTQSGGKIVACATISSGAGTAKVSRTYSDNTKANADEAAKRITAAFGLSDIFAAGEESEEGEDAVLVPDFASESDMSDAVDGLADAVEDIQDDLQEIKEDDPTIQAENNIEQHLIAECNKCSGIFISAMIKSDQKVDSLTGVCPLCGKESIQYFRWYVEKLEYEDGTSFNI